MHLEVSEYLQEEGDHALGGIRVFTRGGSRTNCFHANAVTSQSHLALSESCSTGNWHLIVFILLLFVQKNRRGQGGCSCTSCFTKYLLKRALDKLWTFVEINDCNADEDEGKDNPDQPDVLPLSRVLREKSFQFH